ncbi:MAG TPA: hypothetical protein VI248_10995 [Kineosporiaceae bacterium]
MWTIFNEDLDRTARELWARQQDFDNGRWTTEDLAAYQLAQLRKTITYVKRNSPFYARRLAGVDPDVLCGTTPESLSAVPPTTKSDLREAMYDIVSRPLSAARIFYETTGTTGRTTPCPRDDIDMLVNDFVLTSAYGKILQSAAADGIVAISGPTEVHAFGDTFGDVCHNLGLSSVKLWPHSPMVGFDRALDLLTELPIRAMFCTPGMALTLAKKVFSRGLDPRDLGVNVLMLTGELASPALLEGIGTLWGAQSYNALYASQEASVLGASHADGRMRCASLTNLYEVLDPITGQALTPDSHGEMRGELVVTALYQGAKPLVRYRTGDLVRLEAPSGMSGGTTPVSARAPIIEVLGRIRDELWLGEQSITGYDLEDTLLRDLRGYMDFQIVIDQWRGRDHVTLRLQPVPERFGVPLEGSEAVAQRAGERLGIEIDIEQAELGQITSTGAMVSWKAARIVDNREAGVDHERQAALSITGAREAR